MPEEKTLRRARKDRAEGKSPSTQAGEFVKEQMDHIREGKHGARSSKQAIAIGLSQARRAGVKLAAPKKGKASESTRHQAKRDTSIGQGKKAAASHSGKEAPIKNKPVNKRRSAATTKALQRESSKAASKTFLSKQGESAARQRTPTERKASARKAAATRKRNTAK